MSYWTYECKLFYLKLNINKFQKVDKALELILTYYCIHGFNQFRNQNYNFLENNENNLNSDILGLMGEI